MTHFEIWYALQDEKEKYVSFSKNPSTFLCYEPYYTLVELAVFINDSEGNFVGVSNDYIALIENGAISAIMDFALANHLYEDQSSLRKVLLTPIIRCEKCRIMYIDGVFYWDYVSEGKGRQAATPEQVLARVCIPTTSKGDRTHLTCFAKLLYESELGLLKKSPSELQDFVRANNNQVEMDLPDEEYYLDMAREILDEQN